MNKRNPNRLIFEKSPYLLQHAYNPVDWYAWNDEALETAKKNDKPIFLSIGYSTCYWCHVMERECFENEEIARLLNEHFICIKVDREERTDLDRIYMNALQSMTGSGGWPMSMFLTPDLKPFYAATYIPPKAKYGRAGFEDVIFTINGLWKNKKKEIIESSNKIANILNSKLTNDTSENKIDEKILDKCFEVCMEYYDFENGGFGTSNKFPRTVVFEFLLAYYFQTKKIEALDTVTFSLKKMCRGGIFDNIGGGFHRYSVDRYWRVPHFEKMLYDQALISDLLSDVYLITNDDFFKDFAERILEYVINNLTDKEGGFYSAEDAESAINNNSPNVKEEGYFYLWKFDEINGALKKKDAEIFNFYYGVRFEGNSTGTSQSLLKDKNVLYLANDIYDTAKHFDLSKDEVQKSLENSINILAGIRDSRPHPIKDDKILTNWNGLMISAFCKAYRITKNELYKNSALKATEFILNNLYNTELNKLLHRYRDGEAKIDGTLEDYAFFIKALIDLYETIFDFNYLQIAIAINAKAVELFYDSDNGGFYDDEIGSEDLFIKTKESYDGAEPSGNSIMIENLFRLGHLTYDDNLIEKARNSLEYFSEQITDNPFQSPRMIYDIYYYLRPPKEILITGDLKNKLTIELINFIHNKYLQFRTLLHVNKNSIEALVFLKNIVKNYDESNIYVCENFKCNLPVNNIEDLNKLL